jgi:hypothetical protein
LAGGKISLSHDTSLHLGGSVQHSLSPMDADGGTVMEPACASELRRRWSIQLTFQKKLQEARNKSGERDCSPARVTGKDGKSYPGELGHSPIQIVWGACRSYVVSADDVQNPNQPNGGG